MQAIRSWVKRKRSSEGFLENQVHESDMGCTSANKKGKSDHTAYNKDIVKGDHSPGFASKSSSQLGTLERSESDIQVRPLSREGKNAHPSVAVHNVGSDEFGIHVFADKPANQEGVVDIVAIHGLNGHYIRTWTAQSDLGEQKNWLKDFLPQQIPEVRVMSYSYNSALQFSKSVADIGTFAEHLLNDLLSLRTSSVERRRPVIFICHSLGGLVFKKALIKAHERHRYQELLSKINGVLFFGTPHKGSALASWGTLLANLLSIASFGTSTNSQLSKHLKEHCKALEEISTSFVERGKNLDIFSFYETDKMDLLNCVVVDKLSAVLALPNETAIPVFGNHRTICRFKGPDENRYRVVWRNLQGMVEQLTHLLPGSDPESDSGYIQETNTEETMKCIQQLYVSNYEAHRQRNPPRVPGTCEWFLNHPKFMRWVDEDTTSLLWVSADPGCGKSVLASFLVDHLRSAESKARLPGLVSYFFFKDDNDEQKTSTLALRAILHQIFKQERALVKHAMRHWRTKGDAMFSLSEGSETLWQIVVDLIKDPESSNIICVLDGLDECEKCSQKQLLKSLVAYYTSGKTSKAHLKVLITSRPDNSITFAFRRLPTIRLRGEDEADEISRDVELVIQDNMKDLSYEGFPPELVADLQHALIKGADRTFLWTTLVIDLIKNFSEVGGSRNQLQAVLKTRDIHAIYQTLLEKSDYPQQARTMLQIIIGATRPLTLDEMSVALAVRSSYGSFDEIEWELKYPAENYLKSLCNNFIRIIHSSIYLVHQTAREFLLKDASINNSTGFGDWQYSFSIRQSSYVLLEICVCFLLCLNATNNPAVSQIWDDGHSEARALTDHPRLMKFLGYATSNLDAHLREVAVEIDLSNTDGLKAVLGLPSRPILENPRVWLYVRKEPKSHHKLLPSLLCNNRVALNTTDHDGNTALHWIASHPSTTEPALIIEALIEQGINISAQNMRNHTAMHIAVIAQREPIIWALLSHSPDLDLQDDHQMTVLHHAAATWTSKSGAILKKLIYYGPNVDLVDEHGCTALDILRDKVPEDDELLLYLEHLSLSVNQVVGLW